MTRAEAKREACGIVATQIVGGADVFVKTSGRDFSDDDYARLMDAMDELARELMRRSR